MNYLLKRKWLWLLTAVFLTIFIYQLINSTASSHTLFAATEDACIELIPGPTINVGEEIVFYGGPCAPFTPLFTGKYEWDFGDDYTEGAEGSGVAHSFMRPGEFIVTLKLTEGILVDPGDDPDSYMDDEWAWPNENQEIYTTTVAVQGDDVPKPPMVDIAPILELNFEDNINDSSGNNVPTAWADQTGGFVDGIEGRALDVTQGGFVSISDGGDLMGDLSEFTISFWFKKTDAGHNGRLLNQYDPEAQSQTGQGIRLRFGIDCTRGPEYEPYYGMQFRTEDDLMRAAYYNNVGTDNTRWHHGAISYSAADETAHVYLDGAPINGSPFSATGILASSPVPITIGGDLDGLNLFGGYIDQVKIYDQALTQSQIFDGVVVRHANFQARTAQYITVQLPDMFQNNNQIRLKAFISGGELNNGQEIVLIEKSNPAALEKFLLNNASLVGSQNDYFLNVQLLAQDDSVLFEQVEAFQKSYDGMPKYAIDENNALLQNGELLYPVMPYGLNNAQVEPWVTNGYINILYGHGYWKTGGAEFTVEGFQEYVDVGQANGVGTIGPVTRWDGMGPFSQAGLANNPDFHKMGDYINGLKDHEYFIALGHQDEPNLWGVSAQSLRAWTAYSHYLDNVHPTVVNHMGHVYSDCASDFRKNERRPFTYEYSSNQFGKRTAAVDIAKFDIYPIDSANSGTTLACYISAIENFRIENGEFLPTWASIETSDATGSNGPSPWKITAEQLRMLAWINVVHEVKGVLWFHYFGETPEENYTEMTRFTRQVNELAPAILGPRTLFTVSVDTDQPARIDTILRVTDGTLYMIAVRVSEVEDTPNSENYLDPIQDYPVTATFTFDIDGYEATAEVYEENRVIPVNGSFSDTFEPYGVHIYKLESPYNYVYLPTILKNSFASNNHVSGSD